MTDYTLDASVSSNSLTISKKDGGGNVLLSMTISSGSTMGAPSGNPFRIWVAEFENGGSPQLAATRCVSGTDLYPLCPWTPVNCTAEGGAGAADSAGVFYGPSSLSSQTFTILGFMTWENGLTTAGAWNVGPDDKVVFGPGVKLPGDIVQAGLAYSSAYADTSGSAFLDSGLTKSITPTSKANLVAYAWAGNIQLNNTANSAVVALRRGGAVVGPMDIAYSSIAYDMRGSSRSGVDAPGSTSTLTYVMSIKNGQNGTPGSVRFPGDSLGSAGVLQLAEIMT
ncbi:MAG: hypothetical protein KGL39_12500 [Patescibacteria group bacterium]|nr:hypothetical protein [Patescibacteria group bacterium]